MPKTDDPIVYRFTGADGESLTGIPGRSLRQSDLDAMEDDQKKLLKAHVEAEHLPRHVYKAVEEPASAAAAPEKAADDAPKSSKAAKAGSEK